LPFDYDYVLHIVNFTILYIKKSQGPENITNEMPTHLGQKSKNILLNVFNVSWKSGSLPQCRREADMIPVYKTGKEKNKAESYRSISLISCVDMLMERVVDTRLVWHVEEK
jgi:hypothetical protein